MGDRGALENAVEGAEEETHMSPVPKFTLRAHPANPDVIQVLNQHGAVAGMITAVEDGIHIHGAGLAVTLSRPSAPREVGIKMLLMPEGDWT
jgi:hypothetical protein